jgi:hypothetical protein
MNLALKAMMAYLACLGLTAVAVSPALVGAVGHQSNVSTPPVDLPQIPGAEWYVGSATGIGGTGAASFLYVEGMTPWAILVVNAGNPLGVEAVTVSYDSMSKTLTITVTDSDSTNYVTILVNKAFVDAFISASDGVLDVRLTNGVSDKGRTAEFAPIPGVAVYVFQVEHFSTQTIAIGSKLITYALVGGVAGLLVVVAVVLAIRRRRH